MKIHPNGEYSFVPGSQFAAHAVRATDGFSIERAVFSAPIPWDEGFEKVRILLESWGRPLASICGIELRMPKALELDEFDELNDSYLEHLDAWDLLISGDSPFARTNVAPTSNSLLGPSIAGFSFTAERSCPMPTFLLAGAPEILPEAVYPEQIVRLRETSPDAMLDKLRMVVRLIETYAEHLGVPWDPSVDVHLYTAHDVVFAMARTVLEELGVVPQQGIIWHDAAPPIVDLALEIDLRRCARQHLVQR